MRLLLLAVGVALAQARYGSYDSNSGHRHSTSNDPEVASMQRCLGTCLRPFKSAITTRDDQRICSAFGPFKSCVQGCPMGDRVWTMAKGRDPSAFDNLETACSRGGSSSGSRNRFSGGGSSFDGGRTSGFGGRTTGLDGRTSGFGGRTTGLGGRTSGTGGGSLEPGHNTPWTDNTSGGRTSGTGGFGGRGGSSTGGGSARTSTGGWSGGTGGSSGTSSNRGWSSSDNGGGWTG